MVKSIGQKLINRRILACILTVLLFTVIFFCSGCGQSTDKTESYLNYSSFESSQFEYDSTLKKTKVIWTTTLSNKTIYNFNSFSVKFKLYKNSSFVALETYEYDLGVKHGGEYTGRFSFYAEYDVDSIEYVSWTAHYDSLWETYKIWFIVMIVLAGLASLAYVVVMIVEELDLCDTFGAVAEFFEDHGWVAFGFFIPIAGIIWSIVISYWVPLLIVVGGFLTFVLILLIAHLIKFIVEKIYYRDFLINDESIADCDDCCEDVEDYVSDREKLKLFTVEQLKDYCRWNGIRGYSSLNKARLIDLIVNDNSIKNCEASCLAKTSGP